MAAHVYSDPACRPMSDIDVWVTADQMPLAQNALETLGYRSRFKSTRPLEFMIQSNNELPMYGSRSDQGLVELHWSVFRGSGCGAQQV